MQTARNTNSNQRSAWLKVNISTTSGHQFTSFTRWAAAHFHDGKVQLIHGPGRKRRDWKLRLHLAVTNAPMLIGLMHNAEEHMRNRWGENGTEQVAGLWTHPGNTHYAIAGWWEGAKCRFIASFSFISRSRFPQGIKKMNIKQWCERCKVITLKLELLLLWSLGGKVNNRLSAQNKHEV